jgi:RNA polymerase sigma factor (sigma-70 family)
LGNQIKYKNELISEIAIYYLQNSKKIEDVYNKGYFKYYFIMTVKNQFRSTTSSFYKNVRINDNNKVDETFQLEELEDEYGLEYQNDMDEKWEQSIELRKTIKMNYFESEMMRLYFDENMTYRAIAKEYGINHTLVFKTIKNVLERIKKQK